MHPHGDGRLALARLRIDGPHLVVALVADVEFAGPRMDGDAGQKCAVGRRRSDGLARGQLTVLIFEHVEDAGVAAGDEDPAAVLAECQAIEDLGQGEELRHPLLGQTEDRQAGVVIAAAGGQQ